MVSCHNVYKNKRKENTLKIIKQCFGEGADSHIWIFAFLKGY
jgi:hypothetical protein